MLSDTTSHTLHEQRKHHFDNELLERAKAFEPVVFT